jgi:hypothetical protein
LQLEQTVEELRQIFTNGERGLKGKLKDDFIRMVSEYKTLLDKHNVDYEDEMKTLREQTVKYSEENGKLKMEIVNMKEQHEEKVNEIETK